MNKKEVATALAWAQAIKEICLSRDAGYQSLSSNCYGCIFEDRQSPGTCILRADPPWGWELHLCSIPPTIKTREMVLLERYPDADIFNFCVNDLFRGVVNENCCDGYCERCWNAPAPEEYQEV